MMKQNKLMNKFKLKTKNKRIKIKFKKIILKKIKTLKINNYKTTKAGEQQISSWKSLQRD